MVNIISSSRYKINRKTLKKRSSALLLEKGIDESYDVNIAFVGKNKMKSISKKYKAEDVALPVLTFRYDQKADGKTFLGEILICYPQAVLLAAQRGKRVDDMIEQLIAHGINNLFQE